MDSNKIKKGLGRGLSSLIGESKVETNINKLSISELSPNKYQPRKIFDESIKCNPTIAKLAYIPIPRPWPIALKIPLNLLNFKLFRIIKAKLGPGDIAPIIQTAKNWSQKNKVIN